MRRTNNQNIISEQRKAKVECLKKAIEKIYDFNLHEVYTDKIVIFLEETDGEAKKDGKRWIFYNNTDNHRSGGRWFEFNGTEKIKDGRWYCDGEENFFYQTETEEYISRTKRTIPRTRVEPTPDPTTPTATTEPDPTTPTATTEPDPSIFPLKKGKSGPQVVQLQNFLNDKGTGEKLVTDGKFGDLTYDKLVKYQVDNNLV